MWMKILAVVAGGVACVGAMGCAGPDLQQKVDDLTREQEQLQRDKAQLEADLLASKARVEALEKNRRAAPAPAPQAPQAGVAPVPYEMPMDLRDKVSIRKRNGDTVIDIPSDVFFASGSCTLNRESEKTMAQIVEFIKRNHPEGMLRVEGHSDCDPIRRQKSRYHCNWELSFQRAHAVMHYLVEKGGLDPHHVVCEAYGEYQPLDPTKKAKNRRVEIVIAR
jgi:chemotaxis protein MotB